MKRASVHVALFGLVAGLLIPSFTSAQGARARIRRGGASGVEMSIEGGLIAPRGGTLRWLITAYDVLGLSELRPSEDATVHVATSIARTAEAEVHTDAFGRARVELAIPGDAPNAFAVVIRLVNRDGIQRRYDLSVRVRHRERLTVHAARQVVTPGSPVRAFGRLADVDTGRASAAQTVRLTLRDGQNRPLNAPVEVQTDEAGLYAHTFEIPEDVAGAVSITARAGDDQHPLTAQVSSRVSQPSHPALLVAVAPARWLLSSRERVDVEVVVRSPEGRPLPGAVVTMDDSRRDDPGRRATTDARGHARLSWRGLALQSGLRDASIAVTANLEGWGSGSGQARVRVAVSAHAASLAVESGALVPELGGRVFVRVVGSDGRPVAGVPVDGRGPRLPQGGVQASTDASGIATLDLPALGRNQAGDRCGGETGTALDVSVAGSPGVSTCLTLDPDASARVRITHPIVRAGTGLEVTVARRANAARLPIAISILNPQGPSAIASQVLAPGESTATIPIPDDVGGLVFVRARPLFGPTREVVRGGIAAAWVVSSDPYAVRAELSSDGTTEIGFSGAATEERSVYVVAAPIDEARALMNLLQSSITGPLGDLRVPVGDATEALLSAALAAEVPTDDAAPAVLRGRRTIAMPAPSNPTVSGLLRDPWRARSRFVTGRLALIFRALERYVGQAIPERIDDVAVRGRTGFTFNAQILDSVAQSGQLGAEGATGLGGDPLTIEQLRAFDGALTYDNVARRITRERLFKLLLAMRTFVTQRGFDLPWSRLGNPSEWMRQMVNQHAPGLGTVQQRELVDGWGRPFELRPTRGSSRFRFVDPLGSWEIVSAGPDGRFGGRDDVWDPTARILRSGTPYAEAVGEDILVARLDGVELGRASVELLAGVEPRAGVGGVPHQAGDPSRGRARALWQNLPSVLTPPDDPLGLRRPAHPGRGAGGTLVRVGATGGRATLRFDEEPRTWGAVVYSWTADGFGAIDLASNIAGSPVIVEGSLPTRLRTGEAVEVDLTITNVRDAELPLRIDASGEGLDLSALGLSAAGGISIPAGEASSLTVRLTPSARPGRGAARIDLLGASGERARSLRWSVQRVTGDHPLRLRAAGLVHGRPWRLSYTIPSDARRAAGRVVILTPSALGSDPDLEDLRRRDPALVAFSNALAGRDSDPDLWARLLRAQGPGGLLEGQNSLLSSACAAVAWASASEHDEDARRALAQLRAGFSRMGGVERDTDADRVRDAAATLGALAAGGVPEITTARGRTLDPLERYAAGLRVMLRRVLREHPEEPTLLARAAAALLLADPRDAYGLAMLERASAHLRESSDGGARVEPSELMNSELESLAATAALAVAAHQVDQPELAERLVRGALARDHVALRAGGEAAFWLLAGGAYGALGEDAESVELVIDGQSRRVALESGRATVPLSASAGGHEVRVEAAEGAAFVRVEAAMERAFRAREDGPFALSILGDVGDVATGAGLELSIHANELAPRAVLEIQLPAGIEADAGLRTMLAQTRGVERVEERAPGFVRLWLAPQAAGTDRRIPLHLRWTVRGDLRGLGAVIYPLGLPEAMSTLAPRSLAVNR